MKAELFAINSIASLEGSYFFATDGGSLYRAFGYDDSVDAFSGATQWLSPYNGELLTDNMSVVFVDSQGKKWMGGSNGIQVHVGNNPKDLDSFTYYTSALPNLHITVITEAPDGNIWVGTEKGLSIFNGNSWITPTIEIPDPFITAIAIDKDGIVWIGTKKGVVEIEDN